MRTFVFVWTAMLFIPSACETEPEHDGFDQLKDFVADSELYNLEVLVNGKSLPVIEHAGKSYIEGRPGTEYEIRFTNHTLRRVGLLVAVDGLSIMNRKEEHFGFFSRYFIVHGKDSIHSRTFRGFRLNNTHLEAFQFTSAAESLASRTGLTNKIGRIEVAVYPEVENPKQEALYYHKTLVSYDSAGGSQNLGTGTGRLIESRFGGSGQPIRFENERKPTAMLVIYYNDRKGLCEIGVTSFCGP